MMKVLRIFFYLLSFTMIVFLGYSYLIKQGIFSAVQVRNEEVIIGGEFSLINQDGQLIKSNDFIGKHMLVLFGFSSCKSICPMELGIAAEVLARLNRDADKLQVIFITVDPKRDTIDKLKNYQQQFDHRIQMLTGSEEALAEVAAKYKVYVSDTGKDIDHSGIMYLIGPNGKYVTHFLPDLNSNENQADNILNAIREYMQ